MNDPAFVGALVAGLAALLGLAVAWKKLTGATEPRSISPQPLAVKQAPEYAEKKELDALRVELMGRIAEHERRNESDMGLIRSELGVLRRSSDYVQRRIDSLTYIVAEIAGRMGIKPKPAVVPAMEEPS